MPLIIAVCAILSHLLVIREIEIKMRPRPSHRHRTCGRNVTRLDAMLRLWRHFKALKYLVTLVNTTTGKARGKLWPAVSTETGSQFIFCVPSLFCTPSISPSSSTSSFRHFAVSLRASFLIYPVFFPSLVFVHGSRSFFPLSPLQKIALSLPLFLQYPSPFSFPPPLFHLTSH